MEHWPPLPAGPLSTEEAVERLDSGMEAVPFAEASQEAMESAGCFPLEDLQEALGSLLSEPNFTLLTPVLIRAWHAFVPADCYGPEVDLVEVRVALSHEVKRLGRELGNHRPSGKASWMWVVTEGPQPALVSALTGLLLHQHEGPSSKERPEREQLTLMVLILRAFVKVLDERCRQDF